MQWANNLFGYGLLDPELEKRLSEQQRLRMSRSALMDASAALLANSGWQSQPTTLGQGLGQALQAGRQSYGQQAQGALQQQAAEAQKQQYEAWLSTLPPEQANMLRLLSPADAAKEAAKDRRETNKLKQRGGKDGFMNVTPGSAIFNPDTGEVVYQNARQSPYDFVTLNRPDGSTVQAQRDPTSGAIYDLSGGAISGGPRNAKGGVASIGQDVVAQIEANAGTPLNPEARKRVQGALSSGKQFSVSSSDFVGGLGEGQSSADAARTKAQAESEVKRQEAQPAAYARVQAGLDKAERLHGNIARAKEGVGFMSTGIVGQMTQGIGGTPARNLQARIDTIKANLGFAELQQMRENSPTGGALGGIAVRELDMLQSTIESLDQLQGPEELSAALDRIDAHVKRWSEAIQRDYEMRYGNGQNRGAPIDASDDDLINKYLSG